MNIELQPLKHELALLQKTAATTASELEQSKADLKAMSQARHTAEAAEVRTSVLNSSLEKERDMLERQVFRRHWAAFESSAVACPRVEVGHPLCDLGRTPTPNCKVAPSCSWLTRLPNAVMLL